MSAILIASLAGCQTMSDITGSLTSKAEAEPAGDPQRAVEIYAKAPGQRAIRATSRTLMSDQR